MRWFPDWFNDLGFILTFGGLVFTIIQVLIIKRRQKDLKKATEKAIRKINNFDHLISLSKCEEAINDIKQLVIDGKYIIADIKISQTKTSLISCKEICGEAHKTEIENQVKLLSSNQGLINKAILNAGNTPEFDDFFTNLDEIRTIFAIAISICKSKNE